MCIAQHYYTRKSYYRLNFDFSYLTATTEIKSGRTYRIILCGRVSERLLCGETKVEFFTVFVFKAFF